MSETKNTKGFTLVELLIVIVVIAILAAISIVAYNGIQNRSKTSSAASAASTVQKKAEAANAIESSYPSAASGGTVGAFDRNEDSSLAGSGITLATIGSTAPTNPNTVEYRLCTAPAALANKQATIRYWDYSAGSAESITIGSAGSCGTQAAALTGAF